MDEKKRVVVVLEGGIVRDVYASEKAIELEIIDLDDCDFDRDIEYKKALKDVEAEVKHRKLFSLLHTR